MPVYQAEAVDGYFSKNISNYPTYKYENKQSVGANGGLHAVGGRVFPDVSANGAHMPVFRNGTIPKAHPFDGKSIDAFSAGECEYTVPLPQRMVR